MSRLFVRLAQRATLTAPVLERRARALFEPVGATGPAMLQTIDSEAPADRAVAPNVTPVPPPGRTRPPEPARSTASLDSPREPTRPAEPEAPAKPARRAVAPPAIADPAPSPSRRTPHVEMRLAATEAAPPRPFAGTPPSLRPRPATPAPGGTSPTERRIEVSRTVREAAPDRAPPMREPRPAAPPPRPEAVLQPPPRSAPVAQLARARARAEALPSTAPAAAAPVVQFSIGRLEVRAAAPAAEKRPPARSAGPRLSLEAYLDGRRGGR